MRRRQHRHPAVENAVFVAAILMAVFVARELWLRRALTPAPPQATAARPIELKPEWRTFPHAPTQPIRTETSVTSVAPIKLTRMQRRGKTSVVPVPKPD